MTGGCLTICLPSRACRWWGSLPHSSPFRQHQCSSLSGSEQDLNIAKRWIGYFTNRHMPVWTYIYHVNFLSVERFANMRKGSSAQHTFCLRSDFSPHWRVGFLFLGLYPLLLLASSSRLPPSITLTTTHLHTHSLSHSHHQLTTSHSHHQLTSFITLSHTLTSSLTLTH